MEDEFELPVISKLYDLTSFAVRMRQTVEPKGEFGLDSSILLDGKTVAIGDLYTSLATGFEISPAMNDVITNIRDERTVKFLCSSSVLVLGFFFILCSVLFCVLGSKIFSCSVLFCVLGSKKLSCSVLF